MVKVVVQIDVLVMRNPENFKRGNSNVALYLKVTVTMHNLLLFGLQLSLNKVIETFD